MSADVPTVYSVTCSACGRTFYPIRDHDTVSVEFDGQGRCTWHQVTHPAPARDRADGGTA